MPKTPPIHSIEVAIVRQYPDGRKVTDRALVKPEIASFAQYGNEAPPAVLEANKRLLERLAQAAWSNNQIHAQDEEG